MSDYPDDFSSEFSRTAGMDMTENLDTVSDNAWDTTDTFSETDEANEQAEKEMSLSDFSDDSLCTEETLDDGDTEESIVVSETAESDDSDDKSISLSDFSDDSLVAEETLDDGDTEESIAVSETAENDDSDDESISLSDFSDDSLCTEETLDDRDTEESIVVSETAESDDSDDKSISLSDFSDDSLVAEETLDDGDTEESIAVSETAENDNSDDESISLSDFSDDSLVAEETLDDGDTEESIAVSETAELDDSVNYIESTSVSSDRDVFGDSPDANDTSAEKEADDILETNSSSAAEDADDADRELEENNINKTKLMIDFLGQNGPAVSLPKNRGKWENPEQPGNCKWLPDADEEFSWGRGKNTMTYGELMNKYDIDGVEYHNNDPDFSPFEDEKLRHVELPYMPTERLGDSGSYAHAMQELSRKLDMSVEEIEQYMVEHDLLVHECADRKTVRIIPKEINQAFLHTGGVGMQKTADYLANRLQNLSETGAKLTRQAGPVIANDLDEAIANTRKRYRKRK